MIYMSYNFHKIKYHIKTFHQENINFTIQDILPFFRQMSQEVVNFKKNKILNIGLFVS